MTPRRAKLVYALSVGTIGAVLVTAGLAFGAPAPQQTAEPSPLSCTGAIDPKLGGDLHCRPAGPTSSPRPTRSPTTSPSPAYTGSASPTPAPTTSSPTPPTPSTTTPAPTTTTPAPAPTGGREVKAYLTGYSYFDNTPPGSADISHPVLHDKAGGTGTWQDPTTVAVGHSIIGGNDVLDWPQGTRFYIPALKRYFLVEDSCGDGSRPQNGPCHTGYPSGASTWLDVYVDGQSAGRDASDDCMSQITGVVTAIVDPPPGLPVTVGPISSAKGCG